MHEQLAVSTKAMSLGNAVTAYPPGIMSIHYNPAGLSLLENKEFSIGLLWPIKLEVTSRFYKDPDFEGFMGKNDDPVAGTSGSTGGGAMYLPFLGRKHFLAAPNIGMSYREPESKWTFGFGIYAPFGVGIRHADDDDPARFGGALVYNQRLVYAAPAVACKMTDTFSMGFSVGLGQTAEGAEVVLRAPNDIVALTDVLGEATKGLEIPVLSELTLPAPWFGGGLPTYGRLGTLSLDVHDDLDNSFNVGFLWKPAEWISFGGVYQSEAKSKLHGKYVFDYSREWQSFVNWFGSSPTTIIVAAILDLPFQAVSRQSGTVFLEEWTQPQRAQVGVMLRPFESLRLMCDLHWADWSVIKKDVFVFDQDIQILQVARLLGYPGAKNELILERNMKDTYHVSFGAEWQLTDRFCLRAGYEPRPTSVQERYFDLTLPVQSWKIYSCGAGIRLTYEISVDLALSYLKGDKIKIPNNTSKFLNSTNFTHIIYNPYAGLNYEQETEAYLALINITYKW
jgi:long-subunit fatty acid transport protein